MILCFFLDIEVCSLVTASYFRELQLVISDQSSILEAEDPPSIVMLMMLESGTRVADLHQALFLAPSVNLPLTPG